MGYAGFEKYILVFKCISNVIIKIIHYYIADTLTRCTLIARECGGKTNMDLKVLINSCQPYINIKKLH